MRRRRTVTIAASALAALFVAASAQAGGPDPVQVTRRNEFYGTADAGYFAWTRDAAGSPGTRDVWARPTGGTALQVSAGSPNVSWSGQVDPSTHVLAWWTARGAAANIRLTDLSTQTRVSLPSGINTGSWEWGPAIFGNQLAFIRNRSAGDRLFLVTDLITGVKQVIVTLLHGVFGSPPRLYGHWLVYTVCGSVCHVARYDISNGTRSRVPDPHRKQDYAPSVDLDGNVYFARSGNGCGARARTMKWTGSGSPTSFYALPASTDVGDTSVFDDGAGNVLVFASFIDCATRDLKGDVYSFTNPP